MSELVILLDKMYFQKPQMSFPDQKKTALVTNKCLFFKAFVVPDTTGPVNVNLGVELYNSADRPQEAATMTVGPYHVVSYSLADPGGTTGTPPPPQQDPILSFSHTFSPKSTRIRGQCTPQWLGAPRWEILDPPRLLPVFQICQ